MLLIKFLRMFDSILMISYVTKKMCRQNIRRHIQVILKEKSFKLPLQARLK